MLLFRSEEHLDGWLASGEHPSGERMSVAQQWQLAQSWFAGRARPEWTKRSAAEASAVFASAGLTGDFWSLS
jgi:hypothetical protein